MTEEYKKNILAYLVGKLPQEIGNNVPLFSQIKEDVNNLTTNIYEQLKEQGHEVDRLYIRGSFQSKNIKDEGLDKTIVYGTVRDLTANTYGWIIILDEFFNIIQLITKYSSGVDIEVINVLEVDENGNLMMIENYNYVGTSFQTRFLLLNNPIIKLPQDTEYQLKIRKSYILPDNIKNYNYSFIRRKKDGGNYLFCGIASNKPLAVELKINVSSENEWNIYSADNSFTSTSYDINDVWVTWDVNDVLDFQMVGSDSNAKNKLCIYNKEENSISLITYILYNLNSSERIRYVISKIQKKNNFYSITYSYYLDELKENTKIFNINNSVVSEIYDNLFNTTTYELKSGIGLKIEGLDIYVFMLCSSEITNKYNLYIGRIENQVVTLIKKENIEIDVYNPIIIYNVNKQFNLYNYQFQINNNIYSTYEIYNINNYNGEKYTNINSMVPNQGILYNSQNNPIFARNLYNKVITGRSTNNSIQVPNTYLNDVTIAKQNLLSETNSILVSKEQSIIKNVYETLNINFINNLQISNENDVSDVILNPTGASRLNNSISETTDYDNAKAMKAKLNWQDGTSYIMQLGNTQISQITETNYMYDFDIYVSKAMNDIQIISNDETTIYQTITDNFDIGKFYNIIQMVEIE